MQFYDATTKKGICQEIDRWCDSDDTSYPRLDKTAEANTALEAIEAWIMTADGTWNFDDENFLTLPIARYDLTEGQVSYAIADKFLMVEEIEVLDVNGVWRVLTPFDPSELHGFSVEEYFGITTTNTPKGLPTHYDKQANNIKTYPAPTSTMVTLTQGLRVRYKRTASLFTAVSTTDPDTTVPGFASPFHVTIAWMTARPYCMKYKKDRVPQLNTLIGDMTLIPTGMKKDILAFYGHRELDKRKAMTMKKINYI